MLQSSNPVTGTTTSSSSSVCNAENHWDLSSRVPRFLRCEFLTTASSSSQGFTSTPGGSELLLHWTAVICPDIWLGTGWLSGSVSSCWIHFKLLLFIFSATDGLSLSYLFSSTQQSPALLDNSCLTYHEQAQNHFCSPWSKTLEHAGVTNPQWPAGSEDPPV